MCVCARACEIGAACFFPIPAKKEAPEETEFRQRVILPDPKHDDRSLSFSPAQSSPTLELAREHAALLALLHVQGSLPLERKLPDEFRDVWVQSKAQREQQQQQQPAEKGKKKGAGGAGAAKDSSAKPPQSQSAAPAADSTFRDPSTTAGSKKKSSVVTLTSDRKFASKAEARQAAAQRQAENAGRKRRREALERANADPPVFMSERMRRLIEDAIGLKHMGGADGAGESLGVTVEDLEG